MQNIWEVIKRQRGDQPRTKSSEYSVLSHDSILNFITKEKRKLDALIAVCLVQ